MSISPSTATVIRVIPAQYTAYGTFIHPPETHHVMAEVTGLSNSVT